MGLGMSAAGALGHVATPAGAIPILAIMWTDADLSVGYTASARDQALRDRRGPAPDFGRGRRRGP